MPKFSVVGVDLAGEPHRPTGMCSFRFSNRFAYGPFSQVLVKRGMCRYFEEVCRMMRLWVSLRSNTDMVFRMQLSRVLKILPMNTTTVMRAIGSGMLEDSGEKPIPIS
jgi:hypothetical protein